MNIIVQGWGTLCGGDRGKNKEDKPTIKAIPPNPGDKIVRKEKMFKIISNKNDTKHDTKVQRACDSP
jgi:hypothetical protein